MTMVKDVAALIGRIAVGVIFIAHGWQKFTQFGMAGTAGSFDKMGVPLPTISAWFTASVELAGGLALILGVALPVVGVLLAFTMAGAWIIVHLPNGLIGEGGAELVIALGAAALALGFNGGAYALDRVLFKNNKVLNPAAA
ncbi:putative oxidoreductase [Lentzea xinjiangensis]|uniref:Putative oxidoreductase n=1 Tax=Lentzea xinjiangensis TaxID=402600 RepID=A0A1H9C372_9PSEU|nr:DoxX family protein [Lentzea xinjiangensis]SEP95725.1 putative oxidoreductase [Lentzea xinjiangensis]